MVQLASQLARVCHLFLDQCELHVLLHSPIIHLILLQASWSPDISRRAQSLLHPSYRHQPSPSSTPTATSFSSARPNPVPGLMKAAARLLLIIDFTIVSKVIGLLPLLGRPLAMGYMCVIDSYYFFE